MESPSFWFDASIKCITEEIVDDEEVNLNIGDVIEEIVNNDKNIKL